MATQPVPLPSTPEVPLAVWPVAQTSAPTQRRAASYHPGCTVHPGKMLPALAARIVSEYSQPGELIVDPMCGVGTTLVEAASLGRRAIGVEVEARWAELAVPTSITRSERAIRKVSGDHGSTKATPGTLPRSSVDPLAGST